MIDLQNHIILPSNEEDDDLIEDKLDRYPDKIVYVFATREEAQARLDGRKQ